MWCQTFTDDSANGSLRVTDIDEGALIKSDTWVSVVETFGWGGCTDAAVDRCVVAFSGTFHRVFGNRRDRRDMWFGVPSVVFHPLSPASARRGNTVFNRGRSWSDHIAAETIQALTDTARGRCDYVERREAISR